LEKIQITNETSESSSIITDDEITKYLLLADSKLILNEYSNVKRFLHNNSLKLVEDDVSKYIDSLTLLQILEEVEKRSYL